MIPSLIEVRHALRMMAKNPGFTAVATITLALGIGANSGIFSIFNEVFLRPIPLVKAQDRLVALGRTLDGRDWEGFTHPGYLEYREQNRAFSGLMAYRGAEMNLSGEGGARRVKATLVSGNYFTVLEVNAALGRIILPEEDQTPASHPVAVISHGLWTRRFGADPNLVGRTVTLNGSSFTVVGIAPEGFAGTELDESTDVWIPLMMEGQARPLFPVLNNRLFNSLTVVGRLKPGMSFEQAQAEMRVLAHALEETDAKTKKRWSVTLSPNVRFPDPGWRSLARQILTLLMAAVGIVLLIACANVANLLLARTSARRKEVAVRLAIGASRIQVIRQFLIESVFLSLLGGVLGIVFGIGVTRLSQIFLGSLDLGLDGRVLAFTILLSFLTAIIVGLAPALQSSNTDLVQALRDSPAEGGYRASHLRRLLVVLQVALSLVLVVGAGLFARSQYNLQTINLGFETNHLLIVPLELRPQGYPENKVRLLQHEIVQRLAALPGVQSVTLANHLPVSGWLSTTRTILTENQASSGGGNPIQVDEHRIATRYFETLGVPVVRGRGFTDSDQRGGACVAVISETMARRFWPGEDPIGKRFRISQFMNWSPYHEVVGVVKDTRYHRLEQNPRPHLYVPLSQNFEVSTTALIRTATSPGRLMETVRRQVGALDASLPLPEVMTLSDHIRNSDSDQRLIAMLVSLSGLLALALASVGVYGLMSYAVTQRTHEVGIRMALGAARRDVLRLVMGEALVLALTGVAAGVIAALLLTRLITSQLYGVSTKDPLIFLLASVLLPLLALLASYLPARKAARVDPMVALRYE